jgi:hypothetical protein
MKKTIAALALLLATPLVAQDVVQLLPEKFNDYALNYYLPRTGVEIEFVASKTTLKAGPYYQYARKYLGTDEAITHDSESYQLHRATIIPFGVADTQNRYQLTFKAGQTPYIYVNTENVILSANTTPDDIAKEQFPAIEKDQLNTIDMTKALSEEILMSGSVGKMAEVAAKQIYRIRESRMDILTGEADNMPGDGESLRIIIEELDRQEAALTALFMGTKSVEYISKRINYIPESDVQKHILLRFSQHLGFLDENNLAGAPIYLSLLITEQGEYPIDNKGNIKKVPKGAIAYNIPGKAILSLHYNHKTIAERQLNVAQFGVNFGLDPALLTHKKEPSFVVFEPSTGSILQIGSIKPEQ